MILKINLKDNIKYLFLLIKDLLYEFDIYSSIYLKILSNQRILRI